MADSYNLYECCDKIFGQELKEKVIEHGKTGGLVSIRPDSGDPKEVVLKVHVRERERERESMHFFLKTLQHFYFPRLTVPRNPWQTLWRGNQQQRLQNAAALYSHLSS